MENQPKIASVPMEKITPKVFLSLIVLMVVKAERIVTRENITTNPTNTPPFLRIPAVQQQKNFANQTVHLL